MRMLHNIAIQITFPRLYSVFTFSVYVQFAPLSPCTSWMRSTRSVDSFASCRRRRALDGKPPFSSRQDRFHLPRTCKSHDVSCYSHGNSDRASFERTVASSTKAVNL